MFATLTLALGLFAAASDAKLTPQEEYIHKYASIAQAEMRRTGVPASITLAQGLLESGSGKSTLAVKANNHFGIKCHKDWKGKKVYHDDDAKGECFRAYAKPEESFRDHSDFLRYNDRYKFLFDYEVSDYRSWCYGLKQAENYKSAELANVAFLSNSLNPILRRIENELQRKLMAPALCCKRKIQFDRRGLYACDLVSKAKYQAETIAAGVYTVNEWRKEENQAPVEGGDTVLISANLRTL